MLHHIISAQVPTLETEQGKYILTTYKVHQSGA